MSLESDSRLSMEELKQRNLPQQSLPPAPEPPQMQLPPEQHPTQEEWNDLLDTLEAHADHCVGLAANMIGCSKNIIAIQAGPIRIAMLNPVILKHSAKSYTAEEGCLSLPGERTTARYSSIEVRYQDLKLRRQRQKFSGFTAQIIQHEIDHCQGILI